MMKMVMMMIMMVMMMMATSEATIEQVCKGTPDYNLCVSLLKSDPRGATADTAGLALILIDKIKGVAKTTVTQINGLYKTKPGLKQALDECSVRYNAIRTTDVSEAIEGLTKGNPKFAEDGVVDIGSEASICETAFKGKSPLTSLTSYIQKISDIARAIIRMLL